MEILILVSIIGAATIAAKIFANRNTSGAPPVVGGLEEGKPMRDEINDRR